MTKEQNSSEEESTILFATFLESVPPGPVRNVSDLFESSLGHMGTLNWYVTTPELQLHCPSDACRGVRFFGCKGLKYVEKGVNNIFLTYRCRNCEKSQRIYALMVALSPNSSAGHVMKFNEAPTFGPPVPPRVISLIGPDRELFLQGRRAEIQGLGIGAFSYYRRVVENQKDRLFDEISKVAQRLGANQEILQNIESAKKENQFTNAVDKLKDAIPDGLKIKGHNPLKLLHSALSKGIHDLSDEECLERAQAIRVVLTELAANIGQIMKDEHELDAAVTKLLSL